MKNYLKMMSSKAERQFGDIPINHSKSSKSRKIAITKNYWNLRRNRVNNIQ